MRTLLLPCVLSFGAMLTAQKLPLANHGDRQLQLFDVHELVGSIDDPESTAVAPLGIGAPPVADSRTTQQERVQALSDFLRHFIDPPLGKGDDLQPLADRWLALVGSAPQIACVERLLATARARRTELLHVEVRFVRMTAKNFDGALKGKLVAVERGDSTTYEMVFPAAGAMDLLTVVLAGGAQVISSPRLSVFPMQEATMSVVNQTAYVQDFTIKVKDGAFLADPVVGVVWDGVKAGVVACFEPDGTIGVSCDVQWQELVRPIATFETTLAGSKLPVTIQLPRTHGVRLRQVAHVHDGDLLVLAAQRADGDYLVAVMQTQVDKAPRQKPR